MSKFKVPPKWKKESLAGPNTGSSIRGRISGPIPLSDDDGFSIRTSGMGISRPLGDAFFDKQTRPRDSPINRPDSIILAPGGISNIDMGNETIDGGDGPYVSSDAQGRLTGSQNALHSSIESKVSAPSAGKPRQKKSSMKRVFVKLFGRKQKDSPPPNPALRAEQHRSDPTALGRNLKANGLSQQRSTSLPINELSRALRSHSVLLTELPAADSDQERGLARPVDQLQARRSTTSRLWTATKTPGYTDWSGLSPRPASSHVRDSRLIARDEDEENIGVAVTCHPNRRSRSMGESKGFILKKLEVRRRSDEIRYWRESCNAGPMLPMSSNKAGAEEPIVMDDPEVPQCEGLEEPTQPFNFGVMQGMKITQAANIESRVLNIEKRLNDMERRVFAIIQATPVQLQAPPPRHHRRGRSGSLLQQGTEESGVSLPTKQHPYRGAVDKEQSHSDTHFRSSSYGSTRPSTTASTASHIESMTSKHIDHKSYQTVRPLSMSTTIRGASSSSPTHPKETLTGEHYTALTNMILNEQTARQNLETVVDSLQQQLYTVLAHASKPVSYPTPISATPHFEHAESDDEEGEQFEHEDFRTPQEEITRFEDAIFGDVKPASPKSPAPRMSLSQLTRGSGGVNI
ncbi:hypothetical protein BJ878DRAFT_476070 [Calycina marina]|uniref:Uncharacterized protein n=1 Tax=Calycina marina TaxID=1763456 RepID=A0A9P7ZBC3_9HELO|nr:hypothetical protein BJ878DRAFT_476070 [Calycina marina]